MKDVNPVTVLKTAIQLYQRQPRRERHLGASSTATVTTFSPTAQAHPSPSPVVPTQQHFTQKLENLKKVLPFANEVKLASLLARAQGDMDAVVQENLDSSNHRQPKLRLRAAHKLDCVFHAMHNNDIGNI